MLTVSFHNDGTSPNNETGSYDIQVMINYRTIHTGRLEDIPRGDWRDLVIALACELQLEQKKECDEK